VIVVDPDRSSQSVLKLILGNSGFRNLEVGASLADLQKNLAESLPDLLICESDLPKIGRAHV